MTKKVNKPYTLYLPKYAPEQAKLYYSNNASLEFRKLYKYGIPTELQQNIINQNYSTTLHELRKQLNKPLINSKYVIISYECDCFATVTNSWHHLVNTRAASGAYKHVSEIKTYIDRIRKKNNNPNIKNLKFKIEFIMK